MNKHEKGIFIVRSAEYHLQFAEELNGLFRVYLGRDDIWWPWQGFVGAFKYLRVKYHMRVYDKLMRRYYKDYEHLFVEEAA